MPEFLQEDIKKQTNEALRQIHLDQSVSVNAILFNISNQQLAKAIEYGYKGSQEFKQLLLDNASFFAAHKTYHQTQELVSLVFDGERKRGFKEFKKVAKAIVSAYNTNWLKAEFNAVVRSGRMAGVFQKALSTINLYPNLKYLPSRSANRRDEHIALYGIIKAIGSKFWDKYLPPSAWNCLCDVEVTDEAETETPDELPEIPLAFQVNTGKTGELFSKDHPYYKNVNEKQVNDFIQSIQD